MQFQDPIDDGEPPAADKGEWDAQEPQEGIRRGPKVTHESSVHRALHSRVAGGAERGTPRPMAHSLASLKSRMPVCIALE